MSSLITVEDLKTDCREASKALATATADHRSRPSDATHDTMDTADRWLTESCKMLISYQAGYDAGLAAQRSKS